MTAERCEPRLPGKPGNFTKRGYRSRKEADVHDASGGEAAGQRKFPLSRSYNPKPYGQSLQKTCRDQGKEIRETRSLEARLDRSGRMDVDLKVLNIAEVAEPRHLAHPRKTVRANCKRATILAYNNHDIRHEPGYRATCEPFATEPGSPPNRQLQCSL
jgi:hypothetical protein